MRCPIYREKNQKSLLLEGLCFFMSSNIGKVCKTNQSDKILWQAKCF